jgi:hypothetical protein
VPLPIVPVCGIGVTHAQNCDPSILVLDGIHWLQKRFVIQGGFPDGLCVSIKSLNPSLRLVIGSAIGRTQTQNFSILK